MALIKKAIIILASTTLLSACSNALDRIEDIGKPPALNTVSNPVEKSDYKPVTWPLPEAQAPSREYAGSLWQQGSRHFFRDQRAARVGDIIRVKIEIKDKAELENETSRERKSTESLNAPKLFGLEDVIYGAIPGGQDPASLLSISGSNKGEGKGTVEREEIIETQVAAIVTQMLPNGNMVIKGSQEIRVNFEVREVSVAGVIRPEDIDSDNTIDSTQIAQARISYGGRGQITDVQQPRWGNQVIDILSPF
ncbi:MAG: flagellar basal body L-ring protein FlgH [Rickettsiales bacterium]|nr:flagellar basal body L-ring protein FlgH [Rickettsiales bacterium]